VSVIPTLEKLEQEDHEFKANLGYIPRPLHYHFETQQNLGLRHIILYNNENECSAIYYT
jgi:hypothetical protein